MKPRPTIVDVARHAHVSKSTVSRVVSEGGRGVSEATQHKVETAIQELGYEYNALAGGIRSNRTNLIMLAIPDINNPFWPEVARGIQDGMGSEKYGVIFANSDWQGERELDFLRLARRNGMDGIVINPIQVTNAELAATDIPTVILGLSNDYPDFDMVGSDSQQATLAALEYLFELGHRRIALLWGRPLGRSRVTRLDDYRQFVARHQLPADPELVVEVPFEHEGGERGMEQLIRLPEPPTAVFASNDLIAIGALHAAITHGLRVPEDIAIMGMDDIYAASVTIPALTTMAKSKYSIGATAASMLLERTRGVTVPPRRVAVPCRLVARGTTKRLA